MAYFYVYQTLCFIFKNTAFLYIPGGYAFLGTQPFSSSNKQNFEILKLLRVISSELYTLKEKKYGYI